MRQPPRRLPLVLEFASVRHFADLARFPLTESWKKESPTT
jgi:hypothetical protein